MVITGILYGLASLAYLIIGIETFRLERKQKANFLFLLSCATLSMWAFLVACVMLSETAELALQFRKSAVFFWSIAYSIYLHFIIVLTQSNTKSKHLNSTLRIILKRIILYLPAIFSIYLYYFKESSTIEEMIRLPYGWAFINLPRNFVWDNYFLIHYLAYILLTIIVLLRWKKQTSLQRVKNMVHIIVSATVFALFVGTFTDFILPITTTNILPPLGVLVSLIPIIGVRAATLQYRILQLNPFSAVSNILQNMQEGLILVNLDYQIVEVNQEAGRLLNYSTKEMKGIHCCELIKGWDPSQNILPSSSSEHTMIKKGGDLIPIKLTIETLCDKWNDPIGTLVLFHDLTKSKKINAELKKSHDLLENRVRERTSKLAAINQNLENEIIKRIQMEEKIRTITYKDPLTGLANRRLFIDWLEKAIFEIGNSRNRIAIFSLNLDAFKMVNDIFGHRQADSLLVELSDRLQTVFGSNTIIARNEGNDFLILRRFNADSPTLFSDVEQVRSVFNKAFVLKSEEIYISSTIGISVYPDDGETPEILIKNAQIAMNAAKSSGHGQYEFFKPELQKSVSEEMSLSNDLYQAIEQNQFELYYQPQVNPRTGMVNGMEALIRWHHPQRGFIPPGMFIEIAEKNTLIIKIGEWVLRQACYQLKSWQQQGYTNLTMAVNVSINQITNGNFPQLVQMILEETKIPPSSLEIELTENILITNTSKVIEEISLIRELGVKVAIDDFGTVYSSLNYLKMLPLDRMKIAREFVQGIGISTVDEAIISAIIVMARSMNLEIIGEGVETKEQLDFLNEKMCDIIQGYYFSRPITADAMTTLLTSKRPLP